MAQTGNRKKVGRAILVLAGILIVSIITLVAILFFQVLRTNGEIISSGEKRAYLVYVPKSYQPDEAVPLVISLHGHSEWPAYQMSVSHWNQVAEENNFIVVYPSGTGFPLHWRTDGQTDTQVEVQFFSDLIDQLAKEYKIDETRIYVNGFSNGGGMSFVLACQLSERIAAFGSVSGAYQLPWGDCNPDRPVPAIIFHGTEDPVVPFGGGVSSPLFLPFPEVTAWVKILADENGCADDPVNVTAQGEVSGIRYTGCAEDAEVVFYTIANGGHTWPGGGSLPRVIVGHKTQDIDATRTMWEFFQQHPLPK